MKKAIIILAFFSVSSVFSLSQAEVQYTITDLGTLGGYTIAIGINDNGQVVGESTPSGSFIAHAFLYDGTTMNDLGTLGGNSSSAVGINNSGQVVGTSRTTGGVEHAFLYDGTTMHDLGTLGGTSSSARSINDNGQVVGESRIAGHSTKHAFLYDGTTMNDLGTLGGEDSWARGINNSGQVVGESYTDGSDWHAFLYDGTEMLDLGTLGGDDSHAWGINDSGQIVGNSHFAGSSNIFGFSAYHAFLYDETEGMLDLNDLISSGSGLELHFALDINSSGQIVGYGSIDGQIRAYLMTPIPEPVIEVAVDIKPGSCPNPLRVNFIGGGILPVAILGTEDFDVLDINVATIALEGVSPIRSNYADVSTPSEGEECECNSEGPDGFLDLSLKFDRSSILTALEESVGELALIPHRTQLPLTLDAMLLDEDVALQGSDCLTILNRGAIKRKK